MWITYKNEDDNFITERIASQSQDLFDKNIVQYMTESGKLIASTTPGIIVATPSEQIKLQL